MEFEDLPKRPTKGPVSWKIKTFDGNVREGVDGYEFVLASGRVFEDGTSEAHLVVNGSKKGLTGLLAGLLAEIEKQVGLAPEEVVAEYLMRYRMKLGEIDWPTVFPGADDPSIN